MSKFRVFNGYQQMLFTKLADAIAYAQACFRATCVEFNHGVNDWRAIWQDGDVVYDRPGFGRLVPYRGV